MAEETQESSSNKRVKTATFYGWRYSHYFKVVEEGDKNLRARCTLCAPCKKPLSSALNTTSNFKKHLETVHKSIKLVAKEPSKPTTESGANGKRKIDYDDIDDDEPNQPKRQCTLLSKGTVSPLRLRTLISEYIIEDMLPLSTVESQAFRRLIGGISSAQVPDRKSFTLHLDKVFEAMEQKVKATLEVIDAVSTTADVWTGHNRSYLGMTVHWVDSTTLKRCKAALCCTRVVGRHTYDVLAAKIEHVHRSYGLTRKVTATVTDNGSNFVKAFTTFSLPDSTHISTDPLLSIMEEDSPTEEEITFENVHDCLELDHVNTEDDLTQLEYELPPHERCAAHTLNLVASSDVDKSLSSSTLSRNIYRASFAKCKALWNKASRSTLASDLVQETVKRKLLVPTPTRWNSYFDAVLRIIDNGSAELNELCAKLDVRCFSERELTFLTEYCNVLRPLARGLDILQGEDDCFYGTLLPTLETIIKKVQAIKPELSSMTMGLADCIEASIRRRFSGIFDSRCAIIAAITLPKFKLRWVETQQKKDSLKQMLLDEMRLYDDDDVVEGEHCKESQVKANKKKDFYEFDSDEECISEDTIESEASTYLSNAKKLDCLHKYPVIKRLFLKYNTTIPSSAPVERLFSLGSLVLTPKRNKLTDVRFEKLLLMRYNKKFVDL